MRLVCPNCGAQYAVDDSVIPEAGRDVQCSNCGHGWFQLPDGARERQSEAVRKASQPGPRHETTNISTGEPDHSEPTPDRPARRALDAAVMDVLREEAEREKAARAAEAPPPPAPAPEPVPAPEVQPETTRIAEPLPEPQPEPPAPDPAPAPQPEPEYEPEPEFAPDERQVASETHKARMRGEHPAAAVAALSGRAAQRSEMLPDIEEINSTLRASADPSRQAEEPGNTEEVQKRKAKRGFRLGFGLVTLLALLAFLAYTQAPQIAAAVPALEGPLTAYVDTVNTARLWLDGLLRGAGSD
ncbi:zinc-ribbon domain-containing protein [Vannielia litorea]|uniref:zinc-ribbon domain-containing protein n=1 Tax=Vannielia litorea TaxID=1217970 RepID=UPI001C968721|nr:zinc-ribbon domain-containing protein [Vannielia litorea]MBY6046034.1 zinc-ribbon domain-containing protein [Vannielia litorea]MBY6073447.1 zinc-ribbon domain-containing protein [Vannielia litorea]